MVLINACIRAKIKHTRERMTANLKTANTTAMANTSGKTNVERNFSKRRFERIQILILVCFLRNY